MFVSLLVIIANTLEGHSKHVVSDDDTDIEYIYLSAMSARWTPYLTAEDIRNSWLLHTEPGVSISVSNLAAQSLMFDEPTLSRTIQFGALSGWDSDNGTATMGGLLGMMLGTVRIRAQFPGVPISNRYRTWSAISY